MVADHLQKAFPKPDYFVISIFIQDDVVADGVFLLEDILHSIYQQLTPSSVFVDVATAEKYEIYQDASAAGKRASLRIEYIRDAVSARLDNCTSTFLVFDGLDRCNSSLRLLAETELSALRKQGLSIMVTSRLPVFEKPENITCDVCDHDGRTLLKLFYECKKCDDFIMCIPDKEKGNVCRNW